MPCDGGWPPDKVEKFRKWICRYRKSHPTFGCLHLRDLSLNTTRRLCVSKLCALASRLCLSSLFSLPLHAHSLCLVRYGQWLFTPLCPFTQTSSHPPSIAERTILSFSLL